jgi:deoxyribodipyrimidine photo-lyase
VGPTASALDALEGALNDEGISLLRRCTDYDRCCWPDTTRGYFQLKKRIPALLDTLAIRRPG